MRLQGARKTSARADGQLAQKKMAVFIFVKINNEVKGAKKRAVEDEHTKNDSRPSSFLILLASMA